MSNPPVIPQGHLSPRLTGGRNLSSTCHEECISAGQHLSATCQAPFSGHHGTAPVSPCQGVGGPLTVTGDRLAGRDKSEENNSTKKKGTS